MAGQGARHGLRFLVADDVSHLSQMVAHTILEAVRAKPNALFCATTGATPTEAYRMLAEHHKREPSTLAAMRVLKLDEWLGLPPDHKATCERYLREHLLGPLGIGRDRYEGFRGDATNPQAECQRITEVLANWGPIDLCLLGLGTNGHIGMNEPAESLTPFAHVEQLSESMRGHSMLRDAGAEVRQGLTLGMADILQSRQIVLAVSGASKHPPMRSLLAGKVTPQCPASFLWLHGNALCICDPQATGEKT